MKKNDEKKQNSNLKNVFFVGRPFLLMQIHGQFVFQMPKIFCFWYVRDVRDVRDVNVLKKTKDLMLITYLNPTYLWCFSPDPLKGPSNLNNGLLV